MPTEVHARRTPAGPGWPAHRGRRWNDGPPPPRSLPRPRPRRRAARSAGDGRSGRIPRAGDRSAGDRGAGDRAACGGCPAGGWAAGHRPAGGCPAGGCPAGHRPAGGWAAGHRPAGGCPAGGRAAGARPADARGAPGTLAPDHPRGTARTHRRTSRRPNERFLVKVWEGNGRAAGLLPSRPRPARCREIVSRPGPAGLRPRRRVRLTGYQAPPMARPRATASSSARAVESSPGPGPCTVGD